MEPGFLRNSDIPAYAAHQGEVVLWYGLGRPVITSKDVIGPFSYCLDGVSYSG